MLRKTPRPGWEALARDEARWLYDLLRLLLLGLLALLGRLLL